MVNGSSDGKNGSSILLKRVYMGHGSNGPAGILVCGGGPSSHMFAMAVQAVRGNLTPLLQAVG